MINITPTAIPIIANDVRPFLRLKFLILKLNIFKLRITPASLLKSPRDAPFISFIKIIEGAPGGIRTHVIGVKGRYAWPGYTTGATSSVDKEAIFALWKE